MQPAPLSFIVLQCNVFYSRYRFPSFAPLVWKANPTLFLLHARFFEFESPGQNIDQAKGTDSEFVNISTRTSFFCFPFLSSVPRKTILKRSWSSFTVGLSRASFLLPAAHPTQYFNYKPLWNIYVSVRFILSSDTARRSFVRDVTTNRNCSQELYGSRNDFPFLFVLFEWHVPQLYHTRSVGGKPHVSLVALLDCVRNLRPKLRFSRKGSSRMRCDRRAS